MNTFNLDYFVEHFSCHLFRRLWWLLSCIEEKHNIKIDKKIVEIPGLFPKHFRRDQYKFTKFIQDRVVGDAVLILKNYKL